MAISETTILDPEPSRPGIPLKKSTLAVLLMLLLGLGAATSLVLSDSGTQRPAGPSPVVRDATELRTTGSEQVLAEEEARAAAAAAKPLAPTAAVAPSAPTSPLPPGVRREDNTSALFDRAPARPPQPSTQSAANLPAGGRGAERDFAAEQEAASRLARAVVFDTDERAQPLSGFSSPSATTTDTARSTVGAEPPSTAISAQIAALHSGLAGQQGQAHSSSWLKEYAKEGTADRTTIRGKSTPTRLILRQGKVIPAVLGRQINSDLPGRITAYTTTTVYDAQGNILIPMGSTLVGQYDSGVRVGQSRMLFAFERLVLPNGYSFDLPAAPGADLAGAAGMTGDVNNHFFRMFGTSLLIAVLADKTKQPESVTQVGSGSALTAAGQVLSDVSRAVLERNRIIPPTITVDQGTRINVEVVSDMVFPAAYPTR